MYKVTDQVEHKKSGKVYEILHIHNDTLFGKDSEDNAKSMNIDDVVPAKSEREKVVEDMMSILGGDNLSDQLNCHRLYEAGYRRVVEENVNEDNQGLPFQVNRTPSAMSRRALAEARVIEEGLDSTGWIPWEGGECPIGKEEIVEILVRDGGKATEAARAFFWEHCDEQCSDIIAYKVL